MDGKLQEEKWKKKHNRIRKRGNERERKGKTQRILKAGREEKRDEEEEQSR